MRKNKQQCDGQKKNCLTKTSAKQHTLHSIPPKRNVTLDFFLCRLIETWAKIAKHVVCYSNNLHILLVQRVYLRKQHRQSPPLPSPLLGGYVRTTKVLGRHTNTTVNRNPMSALEFVNDRERNRERERDKEIECRKREKNWCWILFNTYEAGTECRALGPQEEREGGTVAVESIEVKSKWRHHILNLLPGECRPTVSPFSASCQP